MILKRTSFTKGLRRTSASAYPNWSLIQVYWSRLSGSWTWTFGSSLKLPGESNWASLFPQGQNWLVLPTKTLYRLSQIYLFKYCFLRSSLVPTSKHLCSISFVRLRGSGTRNSWFPAFETLNFYDKICSLSDRFAMTDSCLLPSKNCVIDYCVSLYLGTLYSGAPLTILESKKS